MLATHIGAPPGDAIAMPRMLNDAAASDGVVQ
jgi:hypothetical protein